MIHATAGAKNCIVTRRQALCGALAAALAAPPAAAQSKTTIKAVATISILGDLVRNVGGERVAVTTLVGPNGDAHVYAPTPADAKELADAGIVFVNGLGLEGWMTRLITASGTRAIIVVVSKEVVPLQWTYPGDTAPGAVDPHAWQSVANAEIYVGNIRNGLDVIDQAGKTIYDAAARTYLGKLDVLDKEVRAAIAGIPPDRRKIITSHDAFGYFGATYGMQFIAPEGVSTDAEPSAKDVARIISQIRRQNIPAVFLENVTDPRMMEQIARETGAKIGGKLYSDALSGPGGPAATYIDMMRHNTHELSAALTS
jgi:zinc/manganese transport system substrate-binding protein